MLPTTSSVVMATMSLAEQAVTIFCKAMLE